MELSDADRVGDRYGSASPAAHTDRCRFLLAQLLTPLRPHDAADLADRLVVGFGSLGALLAASPSAQARLLVGSPEVVDHLRVVRESLLHALRHEVMRGPVLSTSAALADYLIASMAHARIEELRVLFLDRGNRLLADETMARGTVSTVIVYSREVLRRAIELDASALILVHNHPSGDLEPSSADRALTGEIVLAAETVDLAVHDHLIVSHFGCVSLRSRGFM